jgi:hypothetical protein
MLTVSARLWTFATATLLLTACSSAPADTPKDADSTTAARGSASATASEAASESASESTADLLALSPPFDLTLDPGAVASAAIGPAGGTLEVTGPDATTYVLEVPPGALLETVEITATPVASFGSGNESAHGVLFAPTGLSFLADVTLAMTAVEKIPPDRQLVFQFSDDGDEVIAAEPVFDDPALVLHVDHFSGFGFADLADTAREKWVGWRTARTEAQLQNELRDLVSREREARLLGLPSDPDFNDKVAKAVARYEKEVVRPRLESAASCEAAKQAAQTALGYIRQQQLLGLPSGGGADASPLTVSSVVTVVIKPCEKEAVARCRAARDPGPLLDFWTGVNHQFPGTFVVDRDRAELICDPRAYRVVGGLQDFQVDETVCDVTKPFTLSSGIGTLEASGGLNGTYTFSGDFVSSYSGTYRITFPDGPRNRGKMVGKGSGSVAGQAGSGAEHYTLTPVGPAC